MSDGVRRRRLRFSAPVGADIAKALRLERGIESAEIDRDGALIVRYRQAATGLDWIIPWLARHGLVPAVDLAGRVRLALAMYCDANVRQIAGQPAWWEGGMRRLHVARQPLRLHGRRDERAQHWRKYLERET